MFQEFSVRPNAQIIDQLIPFIKDSEDPDVTNAILETFDFDIQNFGVFGLALHCLGLVCDSRALECLMKQFDALNAAEPHPDPQMQVIFFDHLQRAALSMINLISTERDSNPKAIPYIIKIFESDVFSKELNRLALHALRIFKDTHPLAHDYYQKEFKKHT